MRLGFFLSCEEYGPRELVAQAAATSQVMLDGRFTVGVGSGEALNEHILRTHYTVENARIFTLPDKPPPIYASGFGPKAIDLAARVGDGYVLVSPDATPEHFEQASQLVTEQTVARQEQP